MQNVYNRRNEWFVQYEPESAEPNSSRSAPGSPGKWVFRHSAKLVPASTITTSARAGQRWLGLEYVEPWQFLDLDAQSRRMIRWLVDKHLQEGGKLFDLDDQHALAATSQSAGEAYGDRRLAGSTLP